MDRLFDEIEAAVSGNALYLALSGALIIPDICGAMESADGRATGAKYAAWFDRYLGGDYKDFLKGEDCYRFRCSFLHQGRTEHPASAAGRILFAEPGPMTMHRCSMSGVAGKALVIDVREFCTETIRAARTWLVDVKDQADYSRNSQRFIARHDNGIAPWIVGYPVYG